MPTATLVLGQEKTSPRWGRWRAREELVEAVLRDEPGSFCRLYKQHYRLVHGIALAHVPYCEVDDIVQEVFMTVVQHLHELRNRRAFQSWLAQTTRNRCFSNLRKRGRKLTQTLPPDMSQGPPRVATPSRSWRPLPNCPRAIVRS